MRWLVFAIINSILGCTTPSEHFDTVAFNLGIHSQLVDAEKFKHSIYVDESNLSGELLHVYLDGDGTPWQNNRWVSYDPTARNPLILRLMVQDSTPSILLGRPCYYGLSQSLNCDKKYWTSHRYSKQIVSSMSHVLRQWLQQHNFKQVVLIGYSGGGSLAMLIASNIQQVTKVVTVAANLNIDSWSTFHGYPKLENSLNPADETKLFPKIKQFHFAGAEDKIVPAAIIKQFSENQTNARYFEFLGVDHACCWEQKWSNVLRIIRE